MKSLIIQDLDFIKIISQANDSHSDNVFGGVLADTSTFAWTEENFTYANATSIAVGQQTYTSTNSETSITQTSFSTTSHAMASGSAFASSGYSTAHSSSNYDSTSIYVNYSTPGVN